MDLSKLRAELVHNPSIMGYFTTLISWFGPILYDLIPCHEDTLLNHNPVSSFPPLHPLPIKYWPSTAHGPQPAFRSTSP